MSPNYTLNRDGAVRWIGLPNNGGELGPDLDDIVEELNRLQRERDEARHLANRLQLERDVLVSCIKEMEFSTTKAAEAIKSL
jgi:hypothetical protein